MAKLSLKWPVDTEGYRLESSAPRSDFAIGDVVVLKKGLSAGQTGIVQGPKIGGKIKVKLSQGRTFSIDAKHVRRPQPTIHESMTRDDVRIVRGGGKMDTESAPDVMQIGALYRRLADCKPTPAGALSFVQKYGFMRRAKAQWESASDICNEIEIVRSLVRAKNNGNRRAIELFMENYGRTIRLNAELTKANGFPELFFVPQSLRDAIYLQFLQDFTSSAKIKHCKRPGCGEWFYYGPGTGHRETAQYCSPKCQKAHDYEKSKGTMS